MKKEAKNYAFIDSQNLNKGVQELGWKLDFKQFRVYLKEKYSIKKAYLFLGYLPENKRMYQSFRNFDYELIFKPVSKTPNNVIKGNVDAELVLQAMIDYQDYDKALIVTGDGDFYCLVKHLFEKGKFLKLLAPNQRRCSRLFKRAFPNEKTGKHIAYIGDLRKRLEYKKKRP